MASPAAEIERVLARFRFQASAITLDRADLDAPYAEEAFRLDDAVEAIKPLLSARPEAVHPAPSIPEPGRPEAPLPPHVPSTERPPPQPALPSVPVVAADIPSGPAPAGAPAPSGERRTARASGDGGPEPPERGRGIALVVAGLILAAGLALGYRAWMAADARAVHRSFPLPFNATSALAAGGLGPPSLEATGRDPQSPQGPRAVLRSPQGAEGSTLFTVDPRRGLLFTLASSRDSVTVTSIQKFPNPSPDGLAFGEGRLWSSASMMGRIVRHSGAAPFGVEASFTNPDSRPADLAWDGKRLWSLDRRTNTVSQNSPGPTLFPMAQYTLPAIEAAGMHADDGLLWVFDRGTRRVLRFRAGGVLAAEDFLDLGPWLPANSRATGMAVEGGFLWLAAENPAELHRFDLKRVLKRAGKSRHGLP